MIIHGEKGGITRATFSVKRIVKKVLDGTVSLPGEYNKLIEEATLGYREKQLTLVGAKV